MKCEVVTTRDGARAVLDHETGEVMHPVVGPLVEAERLYVQPSRLVERLAEVGQPLRLLDVGLGAGSNAIAAWKLAEHASRRLDIVSLDRSRDALALALEHADDFGLTGPAGDAARNLLRAGTHEDAHCTWRFIEGELPDTLRAVDDHASDIVFWDPFSPRANPSLWTLAAFSALRRTCADGCTVHTYSSATPVRSALLLAGFSVGLGPAIDANKFATTAAVGASLLHPLDTRFLERLRRSTSPFPTDAPADALEQISLAPQFS